MACNIITIKTINYITVSLMMSLFIRDNIDEEQDEWISKAAEGNVLEAINLAINSTTA